MRKRGTKRNSGRRREGEAGRGRMGKKRERGTTKFQVRRGPLDVCNSKR